jgi:hypothetical protein
MRFSTASATQLRNFVCNERARPEVDELNASSDLAKRVSSFTQTRVGYRTFPGRSNELTIWLISACDVIAVIAR